MKTLRKEWGTNLTEHRQSRGYDTQEAFAKALGVAQQTVSEWERGESAPRDGMKLQIAALLSVPVTVLFPLRQVAS